MKGVRRLLEDEHSFLFGCTNIQHDLLAVQNLSELGNVNTEMLCCNKERSNLLAIFSPIFPIFSENCKSQKRAGQLDGYDQSAPYIRR